MDALGPVEALISVVEQVLGCAIDARRYSAASSVRSAVPSSSTG